MDTAQPTIATQAAAPLIEVDHISKFYGSVIALKDVSVTVRAGEVTCVLGDNGAGKSSLIKILAGVHHQDEGEFRVDGVPVQFANPREALARGIATVYQDLAMIPLMSVWRNFYLGSEPTHGWGPFSRFDTKRAERETRAALKEMGIDLRDTDQPVGTLSGGERQSVAIARAMHFGARVLILDEPTSALGVKQAGVVLKHVLRARDRGVGVILITHNPHHAYPVGDHFVVLNRGRVIADRPKVGLTRDELTQLMAGGAELEAVSHEIEEARRASARNAAAAAAGTTQS